MTPRLCAALISLAIGIITLQLVILYFSATHDHRQSAIIEEAITNVIFIEDVKETHE